MMNNAETYEILQGRFPAEQFALMEEVSDAAGFNRSRSADYVAVGLWPSRGLEINGIEKKASRSDWLNELKNHKKAENIFQYCDRFWLLTTDDNIAKIEEIPITWGWLTIKGGKIKTMKEAPKLEPKPISRHFMATMLKRASDKKLWVKKDSIQAEIRAAKESGRNEKARSEQFLQDELKEIRQAVHDFEVASGIQINRYLGPKKLGEAVRFITDGKADQFVNKLEQLQRTSELIHKQITNSLESLLTTKTSENDEGTKSA